MKKILLLFLFAANIVAAQPTAFNVFVNGLPTASNLTGASLAGIQGGSSKQFPGTLFAAAGSGVTSITGTANQITASASTGSVTLSLPSTIIFPGAIPSGASSTGVFNVGTLGFTDTNLASQITGSANSYIQSVWRNTNGGATASTDLVLNNDLGTATTNYLNLGINSSGFTGSGSFNLANAGYLTTTTGELAIGTTTSNGIHFVINGSTTDAFAISSAGAVSIPSLATGIAKLTSGVFGLAVSNTDYQAPITFGTGALTALGVNVGSAGAFVVNGGALGTPSSGTLTSATGLPVSTGLSGLGSGWTTALAATYSGGWLVTGATTITGNVSQAGAFTETMSLNEFLINQNALSSSQVAAFSIQVGTHTSIPTTTEYIGITIPTVSLSWVDGTVATERYFNIGSPTFNKVTTSATFTNPYTLFVGVPVAGAGVTFTNGPYAAGFGGAIVVQGNIQLKAGSSATLGTADANQLSIQSNSVTRIALTSSGGITFSNAPTTGAAAWITFTQSVATSGVPTGILFTGAAHTGLTLSTEATDLNINLARTVQFATGALTTQRAVRIQAPTYGFVGGSTLATASTLSLSGAPSGGTNATITTSIALNVETSALANTGTGYAAFFNAPSGASTANYALGLSGNLNLSVAGNKVFVAEGANGYSGQVALVSGTKAVSIANVTTSSRCIVTLVTPTGVSLTVSHQCVCTSGTITLQANVAAGTINTSDTSTFNYWVWN